MHRARVVLHDKRVEAHRVERDLAHLALCPLCVRLGVSSRLLLLTILVNNVLQRPEDLLEWEAAHDQTPRLPICNAVRGARIRLEQRSLTKVLVLAARSNKVTIDEDLHVAGRNHVERIALLTLRDNLLTIVERHLGEEIGEALHLAVRK